MGTSLLCGLLNAHSKIECHFEMFAAQNIDIDKNITRWKQQAAESELIWGNKMPLEKFWSNDWKNKDIVSLVDDFKIIWMIRRFDMWARRNKERSEKWAMFNNNFKGGQKVYWAIRNKKPDGIIQVSFEDLLLRTTIELMRICNFLGIAYEEQMISQGTLNTGHGSYNYGQILKDKV